MKKTVTMKVEEAELAEWTLQAHEAGDSLSGWLRKCANRNLPIKTMDQKAWEVGAEKPSALPLVEQVVYGPDETAAIVAPKPPKAAVRKAGLCARCSRIGVASCMECRKVAKLGGEG